MAKRNIIIVGAGLFGSIAATLCSRAGHNVTVVDERRMYAASLASGCVLAPSWLSSLSKEDVATAMGVLGELYPIHDVDFGTALGAKFKAKRVNVEDVLVEPDVRALATEVGDGFVRYTNAEGKSVKLQGVVLVAAGIWCKELVPDMPDVTGLYGCSLTVRGQLQEPRISVYAPYRQAVGFNKDRKTIWFGDGSALIQKTWAAERLQRIQATKDRATKTMGITVTSGARVVEGARPVVAGHKSGYFRQVSPKLFISTGGAKNGTVLAALQARKFLEAL